MTEGNDPALASDEPKEVPQDVPPPPAQEEQAEEKEAKQETEQQPEPERKGPRSGYARLKARHQAAIAELERLRSEKREDRPLDRPKPEQFTDYTQYEEALDKYNEQRLTRVIDDRLSKQREIDQKARQAEEKTVALQEFEETWGQFAQKVPDANQAIQELHEIIGGGFNNFLRDQIAEAENGEFILYRMAKNPSLALQLNEAAASDPFYVSRMIGRMEAEAKMPEAKKVTSVPPPMNTPKGGGSPPRDPYQLSKKDDATDYIRARMAELKKEQRP